MNRLIVLRWANRIVTLLRSATNGSGIAVLSAILRPQAINSQPILFDRDDIIQTIPTAV